MTVLAWKRPPPATRPDWTAISEQLRHNPNKWAHVASCPTDVAARKLTSELRFGKSQGLGRPRTVRLQPGAFEIESRGLDVYARFVGAA